MNVKKNLMLGFASILFLITIIFLIINCFHTIFNIDENNSTNLNHDIQLLSSTLYTDDSSANQEAMTQSHYKAIEIGVTVGVLGTIIIVLLIIYFIKKKRGSL